jgi:DNA replication protein DnaC
MSDYKDCPKCGAKLKVLEWKIILGKKYAIVEDCTNCVTIKDKTDEIERLQLVKELSVACHLQKMYKSITFKSIEALGFPSDSYEKAYEASKRYCSVADQSLDKGWGLYLYGDTGRGKTTIVSAMINDLVSQGFSCYIDNITNIKDMIFKDKSVVYKLRKVDFLFLDDFGTEVYLKGNETDTWINEKVYEIVNSRYERMKPIVFTSNLSPGDLVNKGLLHKTADRISGMSTRKLKIETEKSLRL